MRMGDDVESKCDEVWMGIDVTREYGEKSLVEQKKD